MRDLIGTRNVRIRSGKCDEQVAGAISRNCPRSREAERNTACESLQLIWQKRRVCCNYCDARAAFLLVNFPGNFLAHRHARDCELRTATEICLQKHADDESSRWSVFRNADIDFARGGPVAPFELIANHSGPAADASLFDSATVGGIERVPDMFRFNVKTINVVEPSVPCLGHYRQAPPIPRRIR